MLGLASPVDRPPADILPTIVLILLRGAKDLPQGDRVAVLKFAADLYEGKAPHAV